MGMRENERCGVQRRSMLRNALIAKAETGKIKQSTFTPPRDAACGRAIKHDAEGMREIMAWAGANGANGDAASSPRAKQQQPPLPPNHTYGAPPRHRPPEVVRQYGAADAPIAGLISGCYMTEYIDTQRRREAAAGGGARRQCAAAATTTKAAEGHARGAAAIINALESARSGGGGDTGSWKMARFTAKAESRVARFMAAGAPALALTARAC